ncbi:MAG: anti-sigma factor family protein [Bryobacteraceae bacterium]
MPWDICRLISEEELEEYWFGRLPPARAAEVEAHLGKCPACRGLLKQVRQQIGWLRAALTRWQAEHAERRREARRPAKGQIRFELGFGQGRRRHVPVYLRNESTGGLGVSSKERFRTGQHLTVEREGRWLHAIVRYCRRVGDRYQIGIQFVAA